MFKLCLLKQIRNSKDLTLEKLSIFTWQEHQNYHQENIEQFKNFVKVKSKEKKVLSQNNMRIAQIKSSLCKAREDLWINFLLDNSC